MTAPSALTREEIVDRIEARISAISASNPQVISFGPSTLKRILSPELIRLIAKESADTILCRLPAQASQEEIATIAGWALCAEENGGGPGKCDLNKCVCGSEGKAIARALVGRLPAQAVGGGDDDCEDQGMMATDVCVKFGCNNAPLVRRGRDWCCSNCGISYGEGAKDGALPSSPAEPSGEMMEAIKHVHSIIGEAAETGFNCHDGDWAERLFASQAKTFAALRANGANGWRDISTAPKDETAILLGRHGYTPLVGYGGPLRVEWWIPGTGASVPFEPTHWRPLHEPPALSSAGEKS